MGGVKDADLDLAAEWEDDIWDGIEATEVEGMRAQAILAEVLRMEEWLLGQLDRMKFYEAVPTREDIEFLHTWTKRIQRDLG